MRDIVINLTARDSKEFCLYLWHELTVAGRGIWSDSRLDSATQLELLKQLNEIQHRTWSAHANQNPGSICKLLDQVVALCDTAPDLKYHVRVALDRALAKVTGAKRGAEP